MKKTKTFVLYLDKCFLRFILSIFFFFSGFDIFIKQLFQTNALTGLFCPFTHNVLHAVSFTFSFCVQFHSYDSTITHRNMQQKVIYFNENRFFCVCLCQADFLYRLSLQFASAGMISLSKIMILDNPMHSEFNSSNWRLNSSVNFKNISLVTWKSLRFFFLEIIWRKTFFLVPKISEKIVDFLLQKDFLVGVCWKICHFFLFFFSSFLHFSCSIFCFEFARDFCHFFVLIFCSIIS